MISPSPDSVLLQSQLQNHGESTWLLFDKPVAKIVAHRPEEVLPCLEQMQARQREGYFLAGYLAYESAAGLHVAMQVAQASKLSEVAQADDPLLWFGVYREPRPIDFNDYLQDDGAAAPARAEPELTWRADVSPDHYNAALARIKQQIASGYTYQVNYSFRMQSRFRADPFAFFLKLQRAQSPRYSAYINLGNKHICSATPELFFSLQQGELRARPMKGTVNRGLHAVQDERRRDWLLNSEKNRAENLMIVDMIRNDLGRVAESGSVAVDELFSIETYPTVFQMTSSISARTPCSAVEVIKQMFPCASITGAPKLSTMKIISNLEASARGIYTGSIGYITPQGDAQFNVAIRTVVVDTHRELATYGVGGGIVWDSTTEDEYRECEIKAEILMREPPALKLLEAMRMEADGEMVLLEAHLRRLRESCEYFGFPFREEKIIQLIDTTRRSYRGEAHKLRLLVDANGVPEMFAEILGSRLHYRVALSDKQSNTQSRFIYHKTTHRDFYRELREQCGSDDVIIVNTEGLVTESCIANVVIVKEGEKLTPPLECGLLNGTLRNKLVEEGEIREANIAREDLLAADEVYLLNSVRGWMRLQACEENRDLFSIVEEKIRPEDH